MNYGAAKLRATLYAEASFDLRSMAEEVAKA